MLSQRAQLGALAAVVHRLEKLAADGSALLQARLLLAVAVGFPRDALRRVCARLLRRAAACATVASRPLRTEWRCVCCPPGLRAASDRQDAGTGGPVAHVP